MFLFLQEKYIEVASELIVYTYFFSASEDVLPEVSCSAPTVSIEMVQLSSAGFGSKRLLTTVYLSLINFKLITLTFHFFVCMRKKNTN